MKALEVDGRSFGVVMTSVVIPAQDGIALAVEDVASAPGRGLLARAWWDGPGGRLSFPAYTNDPLPTAVIGWAVAEAERYRQLSCFRGGETTE
jgi:hypothetical protein